MNPWEAVERVHVDRERRQRHCRRGPRSLPRCQCVKRKGFTVTVRNKLGAQALLWTCGTSSEELREVIIRAAAIGYEILELVFPDPDAIDVNAVRVFLQDAGIGVTGATALAPSSDISSEDSTISARGEEILRKAVRAVAELGGTQLCGMLCSALHKYSSPATETGRANSVAALRRVADYADGFGISLCSEIVNRYETNLVNTTEQGLALLKDIARPNVKLHLDTYHMNIEESSMEGAVLMAGDRLGYVHVGESNRGYLGSGNVDFASFLRTLLLGGYTGPIVFESFSSAVLEPSVSSQLCVWRNVWDNSDDLAAHAYAYLTTAVESAERGLRGYRWAGSQPLGGKRDLPGPGGKQ